MWAMWEEKINRACKHSFRHGMERFDIVRGTAAAGEVGVREELAATEFRQIYSPRTPMQSQSGA
jgi:hypothetical protein